MSLLKVVYYPDHPLTKKAKPITDFGPALQKFAEDMVETMFEFDGVGLAAPQVGVSKRFIAYCEPEGEPNCLVNPEIVEMEGREFGEEGCLSLPQLWASVPRATRVRVKAQDLDGNPLELEAEGFLARIFQHECDHLDGIVFPDRLDVFTREAVLKDWVEKRDAAIRDVGKAGRSDAD